MQGASGTEFIDTWHVRDYLGSVRAVYDITPDPEDVTSAGSQILEQNDRKGKEALDKAQLNVQNSINNNFNNDNDDGTPKLNPNKKGASVVIATLFFTHNNLADPLTGSLKESIINYFKGKNEEKSSKTSNL